MSWLSRLKGAAVGSRAARKTFDKAIERLRAELAKRRNDPRLRTELADVLIEAGRGKEAVGLLEGLADEYALAGWSARAIVVLKKIQRIEPREAVAEKLACLIAQQREPAPDPWRFAQSSPAGGAFELGMEEISDQPEIGLEPSAEAAYEPPPAAAPAAPEPSPAAAFEDEDTLRDELVSLIEDALKPSPGGGPPALPLPGAGSPLFKSFSEAELIEVIKGLRLATFDPGEIVVTQGEPGDSLFVVAIGHLRAFLKDERGRSVQVRELGEGDLIGEIALLTGQPRSATIVAASRTELLELDRPTLNAIAQGHPQVKQVLQDFYSQRARTTVEAAIASRR